MLNKLEDNKGMDISLMGTVIILVLVVSLGSVFDFWILTFAKENIVYRTENVCMNALAQNVDYNDAGYRQNFEQHFQNSGVQAKTEQTFKNLFNKTFKSQNGFIYNINFKSPSCYADGKTRKIYMNSGEVTCNVRKILKVE